MYCNINFPTKKALKEAVKSGREIGIHQVGPYGGNEPKDGKVCLEGPWYPQPHTWYATAIVANGVIVKVS